MRTDFPISVKSAIKAPPMVEEVLADAERIELKTRIKALMKAQDKEIMATLA